MRLRQLLQPIAAFVYCNRQVPHAGATRPPAAGERLNAPLNSAHSLKLLYFISWWNHTWNLIVLGLSTDGGDSGVK